MRGRHLIWGSGGRSITAVVAAAAFALLFAAADAKADIVTSFDSGADGWQVKQSSTATAAAPAWFSTGGNPDGYIQFSEADPVGDDQGGFFINTGAPFAGDRSSYYGDNLTFDLRINGTALNPPVVFLSGQTDAGPTSAYAYPLVVPGTSWTSFGLPLYYSDWKDPRGKLTKADFKSILATLSGITILADYQTAPGELTDLDNVALAEFTGATVQRSLSLQYAAHAFRGILSSTDETACPVGSQVLAVLKRRRGDDQIVGFVKTDASGTYALAQPAKRGTFYAAISERHTVTVHCTKAKSPSIRRG